MLVDIFRKLLRVFLVVFIYFGFRECFFGRGGEVGLIILFGGILDVYL